MYRIQWKEKSGKLWIITSDREDRGRIENIKFYSINNGPLAHVEPECSFFEIYTFKIWAHLFGY